MGEGEVVYDELLDLYREHKEAGGDRASFLKKVASLPGIYVPAFYEPEYHEDGTLAAFKPLCPEAPAKVRRLSCPSWTARILLTIRWCPLSA